MPKREGRKRGKDKKKDTFKKYGKNTTRGLRIKQAELEKRVEKRKSSQVKIMRILERKRVERIRYDL